MWRRSNLREVVFWIGSSTGTLIGLLLNVDPIDMIAMALCRAPLGRPGWPCNTRSRSVQSWPRWRVITVLRHSLSSRAPGRPRRFANLLWRRDRPAVGFV
jgi:hypothetical protein